MEATELAPEGRVLQPYPGLRAFEPDEDFLFYGRESHTTELLRRLAQTRFLGIVGNSGSGKSSLVRAGLLPALYRGQLVGATSQWRICVMRPGADPLGNLAGSLASVNLLSGDKHATASLLSRSSLGLTRVLLESKLEAHESLLLVVDQFEELFRFVREGKEDDGGAKAKLFVASLLEAADRSTAPAYVVLTMRSDYIGDCARFPGLPEVLNRSQYLIPRLTREQMRDAIEKPARLAGARVSPLLVERLLNEQNEEISDLPVIQHALRRTFYKWKEAGGNGDIGLESYMRAGTLKSALDQHANELLQSLSEQCTERVFRSLTTVQGGRRIRRPTRLSRICAVVGSSDEQSQGEVLKVVQTYSRRDDSLLLWSGEKLSDNSVVDISHESLIVLWKKLERWVEAETRSTEWYDSVCKDVVRDKSGEAGKWRDRPLDVALNYLRDRSWNEAWAARLPDARANFYEVKAFLNRNLEDQQREEAEETARKQRELEAQRKATQEAESREAAERQAKEAAQARVTLLKATIAIVVTAAAALSWSFLSISRHKAAENKLASQLQQKDEDVKRSLNEQAEKARVVSDELNRELAQALRSGNTTKAEALQAQADAIRLKGEASAQAAASQDARKGLSDALDRAAQAEKERDQLKQELESTKAQLNDLQKRASGYIREAGKEKQALPDQGSQQNKPAEQGHQAPQAAGGAQPLPPPLALDGAWPNGSSIKIGFLNGSKAQRQKVEQVAKEWRHYANLSYTFSDTPTGDARIIFSNNNIAPWSFRGTEARDLPAGCPTMMLVRIANDTTISMADRRMILHEFGHLLGLLDEIQNPNAKIPWRPEIRANPFDYVYISQVEKCPAPLNRPVTYQEPLPHYRAFDPKSIMMAPFGKEYFTEDVSFGGASELSTSDKEFVAQLYPKL